MQINFNSRERGSRYTIGIGAVVALGLVMVWKFLIVHVAPIYATMPMPTVVMESGYRVQVGQQVAQVFGNDDYVCDDRPCKVLKLDPNVKNKDVTLVINGRTSKERWTFSKYRDGVVIKRPNGDFVLEKSPAAPDASHELA